MLLSVGGTVLAVIMFCTGISMFRGKEKGYGLFVMAGSMVGLFTSLALLTNDYPVPGFITIFFFLYCAPFALYSFLSKQTVSKKGALTTIIVYGLVCASFLLIILDYRNFSLLFALSILLFGLLNYFIIARRFQKKSGKLVKKGSEPNQHNSSSVIENNKKLNSNNVVLSKGAYMKEKNGFIRCIESSGFIALLCYPGILCPFAILLGFFEDIFYVYVGKSYSYLLTFVLFVFIFIIWTFSIGSDSNVFFWLTNIVIWLSAFILKIVFYQKIISEIYFAFFTIHTILVIIRIMRMKLKR